MEKGEYRRLASELGLMIVCPDTSPRGDHIETHDDNWQLGAALDSMSTQQSLRIAIIIKCTVTLPKCCRI